MSSVLKTASSLFSSTPESADKTSASLTIEPDQESVVYFSFDGMAKQERLLAAAVMCHVLKTPQPSATIISESST